jgi:hypothetical protein
MRSGIVFFRALPICSVLLMALLPAARADIFTYSYVGKPFTGFFAESCPPTCGITGSFTTSQPLPANTPNGANEGYGEEVFPDSFSFTNGNLTITNSTPGFEPGLGEPDGAAFIIGSTNGVITTWLFGLVVLYPQPADPQSLADLLAYNNNSGNSYDSTEVCPLTGGLCTANAYNHAVLGTWSVTVEQAPSAPVPEPTSLILLSTMIVFLVIVGPLRAWVSRRSPAQSYT